ncbi:hypothetical protein T11_10294 [Trichinella zimbabwensis]|uniref:Uncharacterized protein n=1 Tax=Trichinella zimbabwensis TaxID=268475 RepID=A0A0V1I7Q4_9BILA|nr:hypothetical protein T11_10294 [Trichinella zimbabwensis]
MLAKVSIDRTDDWDMYLEQVILAYRSSVLTGTTSSRFMYWQELKLPIDLIYGLPGQVRQPSTAWNAYTKKCSKESSVSRDIKRCSTIRKFNGNSHLPAENVWLQTPVKSKLDSHRLMPFPIVKKLGACTYRLQSCKDKLWQTIVYFGRLKPYVEQTSKGETKVPRQKVS